MTPNRREIVKSLRTTNEPGWRFRRQRVMLRTQQALHLPALANKTAKLDRPVFVIGAPRSGTTLLYTVLWRSSKLAHWRPTEAHEVWEADHHPALTSWESNILTAEDATPEVAARIKRSFLLVTGTRKRLIDKTPRNVVRIPFVNAIFPDARFIFLKRDGRANVNSLMTAWKSPRYRTYRMPFPHQIPDVDPNWWKFVLYPGWREDQAGPLEMVCAKQWIVSNEHILKAQSDIEPERWTEIRYEDLVSNAVEEIGRLLEFCDLPYEDKIRKAAAVMDMNVINTVTPPEHGKWRRENPDEINSIVPLITPMMETLGYEVADS